VTVAVSPLATAGISAGVAAVVSVVTLWISGVRHERARRREQYGKALAATMAYREFPYAIVRRRHEDDYRSEERVRLSEALREVQSDISLYQALLRVERSKEALRAYNTLVGRTRDIAGGYMKDAWGGDPVASDDEMNRRVPLDYATLDRYVDDYLAAVVSDLRWWRF